MFFWDNYLQSFPATARPVNKKFPELVPSGQAELVTLSRWVIEDTSFLSQQMPLNLKVGGNVEIHYLLPRVNSRSGESSVFQVWLRPNYKQSLQEMLAFGSHKIESYNLTESQETEKLDFRCHKTKLKLPY